MPAVKKYTRINFQNYPSTSTPLNATNLNKMDKGMDDLDDELVTVKNAIENMSFDADAISYDNTQSGLQATDVQGAVDEINDNLSGFKFYPTGTGIVGLIADDSAYTDADGNYVVWGTPTANQLVADNPNTYKSVPSTEETHGEVGADTCSPFRQKLIDINPNKEKTADTKQGMARNNVKIPICGYKQIALSNNGSGQNTIKYRFIYNDGTYGSYSASISNWTDWILIPQNALMCEIAYNSGGYNETIFYYSLLA